MEIQYTCGHRQVTYLYPDGRHPHNRYTLGPGEEVTSLLDVVPNAAEVLVIDPTGPIEVSCNDYPRDIRTILIWRKGNGILFPFGEGDIAAPFTIRNPSDTEAVTVLLVVVNNPEVNTPENNKSE